MAARVKIARHGGRRSQAARTPAPPRKPTRLDAVLAGTRLGIAPNVRSAPVRTGARGTR